MQNVVSVKHLGGHRLRIRFDDGVEGEIDFSREVRTYPGLLRRLRDQKFFAKVFVHPEFRTVSWPGEIDFDTLVLYSQVTGKTIKALLKEGHPFRPEDKPRRRKTARV
jgi:hypothetical protein